MYVVTRKLLSYIGGSAVTVIVRMKGSVKQNTVKDLSVAF